MNEKELAFRNEIDSTGFSDKVKNNFFDYWSEPNKRGKMRFELEKTWDTKRRLQRWFDNNKKWSNGTTDIKQGTSEARVTRLKGW